MNVVTLLWGLLIQSCISYISNVVFHKFLPLRRSAQSSEHVEIKKNIAKVAAKFPQQKGSRPTPFESMIHEHPASLTTRPWNMLAGRRFGFPFFSVSACFRFGTNRAVKPLPRRPGRVDWANPSGAKVAGPGPVEIFRDTKKEEWFDIWYQCTYLYNYMYIWIYVYIMFQIQNVTFLFHPMNVHENSNFMNQTSVLSHIFVLLSENYSRR